MQSRFLSDFLAAFPFDLFFSLFTTGQLTAIVRAFKFLKLTRILRLQKIIQYMNSTENTKLSLLLAKMFFMLVLYLHWVGCLWFWLTSPDETEENWWIPPTFITYGESEKYWDLDIYHKYILSFNHSVLILDGNDIYPRGRTLTVLAALRGVAGALVNANIFGNILEK